MQVPKKIRFKADRALPWPLCCLNGSGSPQLWQVREFEEMLFLQTGQGRRVFGIRKFCKWWDCQIEALQHLGPISSSLKVERGL
jgi:hypothetical protein